MINEKGQGLPLTFVVLAVVSALILVTIIYFVTGTSSKTMSTISGAQETDLATAQKNCESLCAQAQLASTEDQYQKSGYCTKKFVVARGATPVNCGETATINVVCPTSLGETVTCTSS